MMIAEMKASGAAICLQLLSCYENKDEEFFKSFMDMKLPL